MRDLIDPEDGENRAVRAFLMQYGVPGLTVGNMRQHMQRCGFPFWPEWAQEQDGQHLTKAGAQLWLRHLFALEVADGVQAVAPAQSLPGVETLRNVIECLRADARYVDEEGEATDQLQDLLDALRALGVTASEQTYYCPECGVMEENWHLPTCSQPRSLVRRPDGVPACPALPTNADMDRIYDAVLRQFAERLIIQPDEVEVDPKKHPSFYRALMHSAWLAGATADGVQEVHRG